MGRTEVTEAELLAAITESMEQADAEGMTSEELAAKLNCSRQLALRKLKPLQKAGKLVVGHKRDYRLDGVPCKVPVYKIAA